MGGWAGRSTGPSPDFKGVLPPQLPQALGTVQPPHCTQAFPLLAQASALTWLSSPASGSLFGTKAPPLGILTQPSGSAGSSLWSAADTLRQEPEEGFHLVPRSLAEGASPWCAGLQCPSSWACLCQLTPPFVCTPVCQELDWVLGHAGSKAGLVSACPGL